jgi:hypothetical protein
MIFTVPLETFKQLRSETGPVYYVDEGDHITMYMPKPPVIIKATYYPGNDLETGVPRSEDMMMFVQSFLTNGCIQVSSADEEGKTRFTVTST